MLLPPIKWHQNNGKPKSSRNSTLVGGQKQKIKHFTLQTSLFTLKHVRTDIECLSRLLFPVSCFLFPVSCVPTTRPRSLLCSYCTVRMSYVVVYVHCITARTVRHVRYDAITKIEVKLLLYFLTMPPLYVSKPPFNAPYNPNALLMKAM